MKNICFLFYVMCLSLSALQAQQSHCYQDEYYHQTILSDPAIEKKIIAIRNIIHTPNTAKANGDEVYIIPVVVHILYHTEAENIDDSRIFSQINVLNEDYMHLNEDSSETPDAFVPASANINIQFCLASFDPNGDTTSGITRTFTENNSFEVGTEVKKTASGGVNPWDPGSYLNIWVCNLPSDILGFSSLPGYPESEDGIVVNYRNIGLGGGAVSPYNLGRTCTHEIGHYLGLLHIWGDDNDDCSQDDSFSDTPLQAAPSYGCPVFPLTDECSPEYPGVMFMNYMDYTNDGCMNMFTHEQKDVMRNTMETVRSSLLLSAAGCNDIVPSPGEKAELLVSPNPSDNDFIVTIKNFKGSEMTVTIYNIVGEVITRRFDEPGYLVNEYFSIPDLPKGYYIVSAFNGTYLLATKFVIY